MNPRRKKRLTIISSIITGIALVLGLILYALSQNIDLFYSPKEILEGKTETQIIPAIGQRLRIGGLVVPGSVKRDEHSLKVSFKLADMKMPMAFNESDPMVTVVYDGILPDLFREGQGIVANGTLTETAVIEASQVLAKHDENYMPPELIDAMEKNSQQAALNP